MAAPLALLTPRPSPGHPPQSGQNRPPHGESEFADSSGPLFSMYLQLAEEEDKKTTENWKGDADGILIFVSPLSTCGHASMHIKPEVKDRFILCRRRNTSLCVRPGPHAELPGYHSVLPRKHLSNPRRFERLPGPYSLHISQSVHPIFSTNLCCMGQHTLVSQLGYKSHMCTFGDITPAMGTSVHEGHSDTI